MITRRQFSKVAGANILSTWLPLSAFATSSPPNGQSIRVFGVGGVGCNIVEFLNSQVRLNANCTFHTFNRTPERRPANESVSAGLNLHLTSREADLVQEVVGDKDVVFLFAGLGGAGIARIAKLAGATVIAVLVMPFDFEGPVQTRQARNELAATLAATADRVHTIGTKLLVDQFPDMSMESGLEHVSRLAVQVFLEETSRLGVRHA